jgi:hypothetical protein
MLSKNPACRLATFRDKLRSAGADGDDAEGVAETILAAIDGDALVTRSAVGSARSRSCVR